MRERERERERDSVCVRAVVVVARTSECIPFSLFGFLDHSLATDTKESDPERKVAALANTHTNSLSLSLSRRKGDRVM